MAIFWPAVILGSTFVALGFLMMVFRRRTQNVLQGRYSKAQERQPDVRLPGKSFVPVLGAAIIVVGLIAIGLGLSTSLRV